MNDILIAVDVRIESVANLRESWIEKSKRAQTHRSSAYYSLSESNVRHRCKFPCVITLTRIAPRKLDDDNLASAFKAVRDGVADAIKIDDGDERLKWQYRQRCGNPNEYRAEVLLEF